VAAALGDGLLRPGSAVPSVGASGAISGMLGFYFVWFPKNTVRVWVFLFPFLMDVIEIPARIVLAIYVIVDNLLPALLSGGQGGVAYGAHLGGFLAAMVAAVVLDRYWLRRPEPVVRRPRAAPREPVAGGGAVQDHLAGGDLVGALSAYLDLPARQSRTVAAQDILDLATGLERAGHHRAALAVLQRLVNERPGDPAAVHASLAIARILGRLGMPVEAYQVLVRLLDRNPPPAVREQALTQLAELGRAGVVPRRFSS
jgi:hypothetical protein